MTSVTPNITHVVKASDLDCYNPLCRIRFMFVERSLNIYSRFS